MDGTSTRSRWSPEGWRLWASLAVASVLAAWVPIVISLAVPMYAFDYLGRRERLPRLRLAGARRPDRVGRESFRTGARDKAPTPLRCRRWRRYRRDTPRRTFGVGRKYREPVDGRVGQACVGAHRDCGADRSHPRVSRPCAGERVRTRSGCRLRTDLGGLGLLRRDVRGTGLPALVGDRRRRNSAADDHPWRLGLAIGPRSALRHVRALAAYVLGHRAGSPAASGPGPCRRLREKL